MNPKMLYIFYIDTGTTMTFDIKFALESVSELQNEIERECGVAAAHQVLMISGGESLEPNARVCSYSAGTDTNPIFLFNKMSIENQFPPTLDLEYKSETDIQYQVELSMALPACSSTINSRAQLAQECCSEAQNQVSDCKDFLHDQHLQQQGWAAVVANLEDITQMFQSRVDIFVQNFSLFLSEREQHLQLLKSFNTDLGMLAKIPVLPTLRAYAEGLLNSNDQETDEKAMEVEDKDEVLNLLKWISTKDNQSSLQQLAEQCWRGLEQFNEKVLEALKAEVNAAIDNVNKQDMKEIKGLGDRLFTLGQLVEQVKKLAHEQGEIDKGFAQFRNRTNNLDDSVYVDLCISQKRQIQLMGQNHAQMRDIRRRCAKAKEELSTNIHHRLKWITYVENRMIEVDGKLVMYHESLKRLKRYLEILHQIHLAPELYVTAVTEVVRRRTFSQAFLVWASNLACQLLTVHSEELNRRREFQSKFDGHFLNALFPGLEDNPPAFATQAPSVFDSNLPKLTADDVESLKKQILDLGLNFSMPDLNRIRQFFLSKSLTEGSDEDTKSKDNVLPLANDGRVKEGCARMAVLGDRGEFESETDTEEFEKIGQEATDTKLNSFDSAKQTLQSQQEENLGNTRGEVERLRNILRTMKTVATEALSAFRRELASMRGQTIVDKNVIDSTVERIQQAYTMHTKECERSIKGRDRLFLEREQLIVDHEMKITDIKLLMQNKDEKIRTLEKAIREKETELSEHEWLISAMRKTMESQQEEVKNQQSRLLYLEESLNAALADKENAVKEARDASLVEISTLTDSLTQCQAKICEYEERLDAARAEQQRLVKEATDKLQMEYKTELETIRSRFKLMAASTMERSPSDSSLEKIERLDVIELANHEAILAQMKEDIENERAAMIRAAIEKERTECAAKLEHEIRLTKERNKLEQQILFDKAMRTARAEVDRQMEMYKNREIALVEECERYKDTIKKLTESENVVRQTLSEKVGNLEADKMRLEDNVVTERTMLERKESQMRDMEAQRDKLQQELNEERLKCNQNYLDVNEAVKVVQAEKDKLMAKLEIYRQDSLNVSESKKVRLEAVDDPTALLNEISVLENENKRLVAEMQSISKNKDAAEAKVETLKADKVRLEEQLVNERSKRRSNSDPGTSSSGSMERRDKDMCSSVAVVSASSNIKDATTSPDPSRHGDSYIREKLFNGTESSVQQGIVSTTTCNQGDAVLVFWDMPHNNYMLLQESSTLYFLNSDCNDELGLRLNPDGTPSRFYAIAEVVDKEYCHAKKAENRYRVPQGTKFYRVRMKSVQEEVGVNTSVKNQQ